MSSSDAPSSGGSFSIDLERAPSAITELEAAKKELIAIRDQALGLGKANPGSGDSVSVDAASRLSEVAVVGPYSFVAAMKLGRPNPGSADSVSVDAAARLSAVADSGPGSFVDAMNAGLIRVETLLEALRADLDGYRRAENHNDATLRG